MRDISDESGSDEEEDKRLSLAREIARRQSEPATNFAAKNRSKKKSRFRSPPPTSRVRQSSSSTEEDGEIIQEGIFWKKSV